MRRDLEAERFIGGIAKKHIGYMGDTMQLKAMYEGIKHRGQTPSCKLAVDRASVTAWFVAVQREIEMKGIPTVLITVSPEDRNYVANFTDKT